MAQKSAARNQNPYSLLLLEVTLLLLATGFLAFSLHGILDRQRTYLVLILLAAATLVHIVSATIASKDISLTGNYGQKSGPVLLLATFILGLAFGMLPPLLEYWQLSVADHLINQLLIASTIVALGVFSGSALNRRLLLVFILPAFMIPIAWLVLNSRQEPLMMWGLLLLTLLLLSRASDGLEDIIERFLSIARGNTELVKNLASTRDEALQAQRLAEQAHKDIQSEINERQKAEEKIKASEQELARILDDMLDTYFQVDANGMLVRVSPSIEWMAGYGIDEAVNRPWREFFASNEGYAGFISALEAGFGRLHNHEVQLRHKDGHEVWVTLNAHYRDSVDGRRQGFEGIVRDTTEALLAKESLFQEKETWRVTLGSIADGVVTTDVNGNVAYLNPVAEKMTGWSNELAVQKPLAEVMSLVDESKKRVIDIPLDEWLKKGQRASLADPAMLIGREGTSDTAIELSGAPIRDSSDQVIGSIMVFHDVTRLRGLAMQLSYQATHDGLTGLINRVEFDSRVEQAVHSANQHEKQHALMYIDLDQFKIVNDTCGHPAGDELLKLVTRTLRGCLRESDVLARLGGDEFGVLLLGCPLNIAETIADKLRQSVEDLRFRRDNMDFRIGTSIGLVPIVDSHTPLTDLMKAVDSACYIAKEQGRNRVHVYRPDDAELAERHGQMQWMQRIQQAVENDEFVLYAQPIESLEGERHTGRHVEVLLRMVENKGRDNERLIPPAAFLPAAERYHLMPLVDRWVIKNTFDKLVSNDAVAIHLSTCAINMSGQSLSDMTVFDYIVKQLEETELDPRRICFEITESAVIANMELAREFVNGLRKLGCRFSLDDFGSGLSTFDYLKQLDVDYVKLDGSLVREIATSRISQAMVHAVNYVTHVMGMKSIAEFVESDSIVESLRKVSVDYVQGYAIGKPAYFHG